MYSWLLLIRGRATLARWTIVVIASDLLKPTTVCIPLILAVGRVWPLVKACTAASPGHERASVATLFDGGLVRVVANNRSNCVQAHS